MATTASATVDPQTVLVTELLAMDVPQDKLTLLLLDARSIWAFRNMYTYAGANVVVKASLNARPSLYDFHAITNMFLIFCPIIIGTFFLASHFFRYMPGVKQRFLAIRKEERIIAIFHFIFALSFTIKIVPQTIWVCHLLYGPNFPLQFNNNYKRLWACAISNALLYLAEGCVRSVVRVNPFLIGHHILYFVFFLVPIVRDDIWGSKLILLLDTFIVLSELPLYLSLLAHRFIISTRKVKIITWFCCLWSAAVRVLELVILICYFQGTRARMAMWGDTMMWGWFLALAIPGGGLVVCFSFGIFWWFLVKRDRHPEKYGAKRYNLPHQNGSQLASLDSGEDAKLGVARPHPVPLTLDP